LLKYKYLAGYRFKNYFIRPSKFLDKTFKLIVRMSKFFTILTISLSPIYFNGLTKLFSDLYLAKFLNTSAKSFSLRDLRK